jgi:hypothetical protein
VLRLIEREEAAEALGAAIDSHDYYGRARAVASGDVLSGRVADVRLVPRAGSRYRATILDVDTDQDAIRFRERTEVVSPDDRRIRGVFESVRSEAGGRRVTVRLTAGMRRPGRPAVGALVAFAARFPEPERARRVIGDVFAKVRVLPCIR